MTSVHDPDQDAASDDDILELSTNALAALQEFYSERECQEQTANEKLRVEENWQLSQFWYNDNTAVQLCEEVLKAVGEQGRICCLSAPTVYEKLHKIKPDTCVVTLLEYDRRFEKYGDSFVFYDYNKPLELPTEMHHYYDIVLADPPFLSDECLEMTAQTIQFLTSGKVLLCTGTVMKDKALELLGVDEIGFKPEHDKRLANEFSCYSNYKTAIL